MYICLCNPFTDKELDQALACEEVRNKTSDVYKACSGGEKPGCGACVCQINDRIKDFQEKALLMVAE